MGKESGNRKELKPETVVTYMERCKNKNNGKRNV